MPLVTITLVKGRSTPEKHLIADKVHAALVNTGVPGDDRFQRIIELEPENFIYDRNFPDLHQARTPAFILIEIVWSAGRSVKIKRKLLGDLMDGLKAAGQDPNDVMVAFIETAWENWAFANGEQIHI
ncbi:tautomerase family protein [Dyadobacter fanqingshengii]|uniref:Tautomerase family protein n=1 Tax=Dyadobacter fanqingshengii TaxID=2906443 RepID=A0A9X1PE48_9BACT|nr:tautomerase family protein [Dyadobacter fanqingshengii]MCF0041577.1 tautomerase family protein [Dyadobacter fanqingshengii]USJ36706.1 tautomerase family protein [Dyadobacter fanqingshengii]